MAQVGSEPITGPGLGPPEAGGAPSQRIIGRTPWQIFWRRFRKDRLALAGIVILLIVVVLALGAPLIAALVGHGPNDTFVRRGITATGLINGPDGDFFFGFDDAGRDLFVRVVYGARTSLTVALLATGISLVIGVTLGLISGYYRGKVDTFVSRLIDVVLALPIFLLALGLAAACGLGRGCFGGFIQPGVLLVSYIIGLFNWPYIARIIRGQVLSLREKEFVEAARSQGSGDLRIMAREILPNVAAPIIVYTTLIIPNNILFEAALSFLGVGTSPLVPSWGRMLFEASETYVFAWWTMVFPGVFLFMATLAFNLVGDGLRDALDPRTAR